MLQFSPANSKTKKLAKADSVAPFLSGGRRVFSMDLLSGHYCPFAKECLSKAMVNKTGKKYIVDGKFTKFRCFSASQEAQYPGTYNKRKANSDKLRELGTTSKMAATLLDAMPEKAGIIRIHVSGDFFNQNYFDAWLRVARLRKDVLFYAYTKSLPYWTKRIKNIPFNMVLTASYGGRKDNLISEYGLRSAIVVYSVDEAKRLGLEIDNDDSHAADPARRHNNFALLIHGTQPKGSFASVALQKLKKEKASI